MSIQKLRVNLSNVDFSSLRTEEDFRREAERLYPACINGLAESYGETLWDEARSVFRDAHLVGFESSKKGAFVRRAKADFARDLSAEERKEIEDEIVNRLKEKLKELIGCEPLLRFSDSSALG